MKRVLCPKCGGLAHVTATRYGPRWACCGLWSWQGRPLANAATHEARQLAHAAFDPLWKSGKVTRTRAYELLAELMGMTRKDCHISLMDEQTARRVLTTIPRLREAVEESNDADLDRGLHRSGGPVLCDSNVSQHSKG